MTDQPPPLDYKTPNGPPDPVRYGGLKFFAGVCVGIGVIVLATLPGHNPNAGLLVAFLEFMTGLVVSAASPQSKAFGLGLVCAIPIGIMLFFVGCALKIGRF